MDLRARRRKRFTQNGPASHSVQLPHATQYNMKHTFTKWIVHCLALVVLHAYV